MKTLNTKEMLPWTSWFIYGDTRSGKTEAASTFPRPLFIVPKTEDSTATLQGRDVPYVYVTAPYGDFNESKGEGGMMRGRLPDGNMSGDGILEKIEAQYKKNPDKFPYDTIVIEALTHYCDLVEEHLTANGKQMDQLRWGMMKDHLRAIHHRLSAMQIHRVYISLANVKEIEHAKLAVGGPMLSGRGALTLPSSCHVVAYTERVGNKYLMHFKPRGIFQAGTRLRGLPEEVEDFTFESISKFLEEPPPEEKKVSKLRMKPPKVDPKAAQQQMNNKKK